MNLSRYYHTLKYLKTRQIAYRIYYSLRRYFRKASGFRYALTKRPVAIRSLNLYPSLPAQTVWVPENNAFTFLNLSHAFGEQTDWRFQEWGKLWTYNLHYFEYLDHERVSTTSGVQLIHDFIRCLPATPEALEPYPTALRIIFWSRFMATRQVDDPEIDASLYAQAYALADQIEYHLLGNHYLENGFGLLFAAYRFKDQYLYKKAAGILRTELDEQILADGAHFERSPMYHQIILYRLLDCLNLVSQNPGVFREDMSPLLQKKAEMMLGWLQQMTFSNGKIPLFNDSAFGIAPDSESLLEYGRRLGVHPSEIALGESGYRKFSGPRFELMADAGAVGPDYIPGHAHSDTLSFELYIDGRPFIVDTGISTYEKNERRQYERSTIAHNTVQINHLEQTEVWGGFRVARRARPILLSETDSVLRAAHTGYDRLGVRAERAFECGAGIITITDKVLPLKPGATAQDAVACLHFSNDVVIIGQGRDFLTTAFARIHFAGCESVEIQDYEYAPAFNRRIPAKKAVIRFANTLKTTLNII